MKITNLVQVKFDMYQSLRNLLKKVYTYFGKYKLC